MVAVLVPVALVVMRRGPETVGAGPDGDPLVPRPSRPSPADATPSRIDLVRTWRFWSVSAPFALGLLAQLGVLTHQVALVTPVLGRGGAARAVSVTMLSALIGRLVTGFAVDRLHVRRVASVTLAAQSLGVVFLTGAETATPLYAGCVLFGWGVGNLTTLPGMIVAKEWPREHFAVLIGLVVAINQFTFAFGPSLVGFIRDGSGGYGSALALCVVLQLLAAALVLRGR